MTDNEIGLYGKCWGVKKYIECFGGETRRKEPA